MTSNRRRDERGSASIQLVILLPALFAVMFLGMQAALYYQARTLAIAAAQEGARAAGAQHGMSADGNRAAREFLADADSDSLEGARTQASRTPTSATVTVTGRSLSVIPGWHLRVLGSSTVAAERITAPR